MHIGFLKDVAWLLGLVRKFVKLVVRLFLRSPRVWAGVGFVAFLLFAIAGADSGFVGGGHAQLHILRFLNYNQTQWACLGVGILGLACFAVPVARQRSNLFTWWPWMALAAGGFIVTKGKVWDIPHFIQTSPAAAVCFLLLITLGPPLLGLAFIVQKPPKKNTKFSKFNKGSQDRGGQ